MQTERLLIDVSGHDIKQEILNELRVVKEDYAEPREDGKKDWFNTDFTIWFSDAIPSEEELVSVCIPVKPQTIGAEVFVTVTENAEPFLIELLGGEAFPKNYFSDELDVIERELEILKKDKEVDVMALGKARFIRVFDLGNKIAFLASDITDISSLLELDSMCICHRNITIDMRIADSGEVLIDGIVDR